MQAIRTASSTTYFCINYPPSALGRFASSLKSNPAIAYRHFYLDILVAVDAGREWRKIIGERRSELLEHERMYAGYKGGKKDTLTFTIHRLARDWNVLGQDCAEYVSAVDFLQRAYDKYCKATEQSTWKVEKSWNTQEYLGVLKSQGVNCEKWTTVYKERTNIRINLVSIREM